VRFQTRGGGAGGDSTSVECGASNDLPVLRVQREHARVRHKGAGALLSRCPRRLAGWMQKNLRALRGERGGAQPPKKQRVWHWRLIA